MALCSHSDETLSDIAADLAAIQKRLADLRKDMKESGVPDLGFDGEKGQVVGRTAIHSFLGAGEERLRKIKAERYLQKREANGIAAKNPVC